MATLGGCAADDPRSLLLWLHRLAISLEKEELKHFRRTRNPIKAKKELLNQHTKSYSCCVKNIANDFATENLLFYF